MWDAFGERETEISAGHVIRMLQEKGDWQPFTQEDIESFYQRSGYRDGFTFNGLVEPKTKKLFDGRQHTVGGGLIIHNPDGKFEVTEAFVKKVYKSSPRE